MINDKVHKAESAVVNYCESIVDILQLGELAEARLFEKLAEDFAMLGKNRRGLIKFAGKRIAHG